MSASPRPATARTQLPVPPELLLRILDHVSDDRLDVFQCLHVSKQFHAVAKLLWMRHLGLPLSKLPKMVNWLQRGADDSTQAFPGLITLGSGLQHIKTIRIWDDDARQNGTGDDNWGAAFRAFCTHLVDANRRHQSALPDFDLSFRISSASVLKATLQHQASIAERVVAVRVLVVSHACLSTQNQSITELYRSDLAKMLLNITKRQSDSKVPPLAIVSIEDSDRYGPRPPSFDAETFDLMRQSLPLSIETLSLNLSFGGVQNASCRIESDRWISLHPVIEHFLTNHQDQIEEVALEGPQCFPDFRPWSLKQTFPKLTRFVIGCATTDAFIAFLSRHPHLVDLYIRGPIVGDLPTEAPVMPNLRILRGDQTPNSAAMVRMLLLSGGLMGGSSVAHLQLDLQSARHLRNIVPLDGHLGLVGTRLSCLDITVEHKLCDTIRSLTRSLKFSLYFLMELSVTSFLAPSRRSKRRGSSEDCYDTLRNALCSLQRARELVHLRLDLQVAHRLNNQRRLRLWADEVPPALHVVTWHVPAINETQYLRVIRRSAPTASGEEELQCRLVPISAHMAGVRERTSGMLWDENVLLDYTQQPPIPPPFAGFEMSIEDPKPLFQGDEQAQDEDEGGAAWESGKSPRARTPPFRQGLDLHLYSIALSEKQPGMRQ
ncbi:hypothetical protein OC834_000921 [Tilletia horrida]|nr:hypothetical protein OC834_000921 [Tilletia horrida]